MADDGLPSGTPRECVLGQSRGIDEELHDGERTAIPLVMSSCSSKSFYLDGGRAGVRDAQIIPRVDRLSMISLWWRWLR